MIMPRYLVERGFEGGLNVPMGSDGRTLFDGIVKNNVTAGVTWVHSYVSEDRSKTFCVYDGPNAEAIRKAATANGLPVDRISLVTVLDPYYYG